MSEQKCQLNPPIKKNAKPGLNPSFADNSRSANVSCLLDNYHEISGWICLIAQVEIYLLFEN